MNERPLLRESGPDIEQISKELDVRFPLQSGH
jgi:hypothetical protein